MTPKKRYDDYNIFKESKKDWKKYYEDKINIISDGITEFYINENKSKKENVNTKKNLKYYKEDEKGINFYETEIDKINIYDIKNYNYGFTSRFFYGIYDFERNKGWIKLHGVKTDEFLIKAGLFKEGYYDVNILERKRVYGGKNEIKNWANIGHKNRFKNNSKKCFNLEVLAYELKTAGANTKLIKAITNIKDSFFRGQGLLKKLFNSQLKLLRYIKKQDKDRIKIKPDLYHNDIYKYEKKYGYTPKERYRRKYFMMLNYLGKENRVILKLGYHRSTLYEDITKKIEGDESGNFIKSLLEVSNTNNINFKLRKKIFLEKYRELFLNNNNNNNNLGTE